jgi:hypothetical protein
MEITNTYTGNEKMTNAQQKFEVTLHMRDTITGESVTRTIDSTNAMDSDGYGWKLGTVASQRKNLKTWITERGNFQHDTILDLDSFSYIGGNLN